MLARAWLIVCRRGAYSARERLRIINEQTKGGFNGNQGKGLDPPLGPPVHSQYYGK